MAVNTTYFLQTDNPITISATAGEDIGYDDTPIYPLPPNTTTGLILQWCGNNMVCLMAAGSVCSYAGVNEIPSREDELITVRKVGIVWLVVGPAGIVTTGDMVYSDATALGGVTYQTTDIRTWADATGERCRIGEALDDGVARTSATAYEQIRVRMKG